MIEFRNSRFIKSIRDLEDRPDPSLPEILFVGKSNVGKSSLINALCENKSLAYTSSKPGHTRLLNYYEIDRTFYLVDAPGYGYSSAGKSHADLFAKMMESYFSRNSSLKGIVFLVDSRHKPSSEDLDFYNFLCQAQLPFIIGITKTDKLNQKETHAMKVNIQVSFPLVEKDRIIPLSALRIASCIPLRKLISNLLAE